MTAADDALAAALEAVVGPEGGGPAYYDPKTTAWLPVPDLADQLERQAEAATRDALLAGADTKTGAPAVVRAAVGAAPSDAQRLATLRKSYPDAEAVPGTGNFVFTDQTGRRMTYAPMGWRVPTAGDIASIGPEIAATVGGIGGGLLGTAAGGPGAGSAIGGGLGATAGREAYQRIMPSLLDVAPDTRGAGTQAVDAALDAAVNTALPWAAGGVGRAIAQSMGGGSAVRQAAMALEAAGLVPRGYADSITPGVATGSRGLQRIESAIEQTPLSGGLRQAGAATRAGTEAGIGNLAERVAGGGVVPDPETLNANVADAARRATANFLTQRDSLDQAAEGLIGRTRATDLQPLRNLRNQLAGELARAPESLGGQYQPAIDRIDSILADAANAGGTLPFDVVRNLRTNLGKSLDWSETYGQTDPVGIGPQKQLYGSLKDVLMDAAGSAGPSARAALVAHDDWVRAFSAEGGPRETFAALADPLARPGKLVDMMKSGTESDTNALGYMRHYMAPADLQELQAGVIQRLGESPENQFDANLFARNWNRTKQQARDLMFGPGGPGTAQEALGQLATVQNAMRAAGRTTGFSNTAAVMAALGALGAGGTALLGGDLETSGKVGMGLAMPALAGRLLTSPLFTRWLTGAYGINPTSAAQWTQHLGRLGAIGEADPRIRDAVAQYRAQLPTTLP